MTTTTSIPRHRGETLAADLHDQALTATAAVVDPLTAAQPGWFAAAEPTPIWDEMTEVWLPAYRAGLDLPAPAAVELEPIPTMPASLVQRLEDEYGPATAPVDIRAVIAEQDTELERYADVDPCPCGGQHSVEGHKYADDDDIPDEPPQDGFVLTGAGDIEHVAEVAATDEAVQA